MYRSEIRFEHRAILSKSMLDELNLYSRIAVESRYSSYSNGILYGLEYRRLPDGSHEISSGALKYKGEIYFLQKPLSIEKEVRNQIEIDSNYSLFFCEDKTPELDRGVKKYSLNLLVTNKEHEDISGFFYARVNCCLSQNNEKILRLVLNNKKRQGFGLFASDDNFPYKYPPYFLERRLKPILDQKKYKHPLDFIIFNYIAEKKPVPLAVIKLYLQTSELDFDDSIFETTSHSIDILDLMLKASEKLEYRNNIIKEPCEDDRVKNNKIVINSNGVI